MSVQTGRSYGEQSAATATARGEDDDEVKGTPQLRAQSTLGSDYHAEMAELAELVAQAEADNLESTLLREEGLAGRKKRDKKKKKRRKKKKKKKKKKSEQSDAVPDRVETVSVGIDEHRLGAGIEQYYLEEAGQIAPPKTMLEEESDQEHEYDDLTDSDVERERERVRNLAERKRLAQEQQSKRLHGMVPVFRNGRPLGEALDAFEGDDEIDEDSDDSSKSNQSLGDAKYGRKEAPIDENGIKEHLNAILHANDHTMLLGHDMVLKSDKAIAAEAREATKRRLRQADRRSLLRLPKALDRGVLNKPIKPRKLRKREQAAKKVEEVVEIAVEKRRHELYAEATAEDDEEEENKPTDPKQLARAAAEARLHLPPEIEADYHVRFGEGLGPGDSHKRWVRPQREAALANRWYRMFRRGRGNFFKQSTHSLGPAVTQYFYFVKHLVVVFAIMTIISIPTYNLMASGNGTDALVTNGEFGDGDEIGWSSLTAGNVRITTIQRDVAGDIVSLNTTHLVDGRTGSEVSASVAAVDTLCCFVFLAYLVWMRYSTYTVERTVDADDVTTRRYSVMIRGLPVDATEQEVKRHFSDLFQLTGPDWESSGCLWFLGRKRSRPVKSDLHGASEQGPPRGVELGLDHMRPVSDVANTRDARYFGSWVAEATLTYKDGHAMRRFLKRDKLMRTLERLRARVKMYSDNTLNNLGPSSILRRFFLCCLWCQEDRINRAQAKFTGHSSAAAAAFIVFNNEESYRRCVRDYASSKYMLSRWFQPSALRLRGRHALQVEPAAEPKDVRWENLDTPPASRFLRRSVTNMLATMLILVTLLFLILCQTKRDEFREYVFPNKNLCNLHIPAALHGQYIDIEEPLLVRNPTPGKCPYPWQTHFSYHTNLTLDGYAESRLWELGLLTPVEPDFRFVKDGVVSLYKSKCAQPSPCNRPCLDPDDTTICTPLVCQQPAWRELNDKLICNADTIANYSVQTVKYCYCNQAVFKHIEDNGSFIGFLTLMFWAEDLCSSYVNEFIFIYASPYFSVFFAGFVNWLLQLLLSYMVRNFERHPDKDREAYAIGTKLFWTSFVNSGLVVLLVFAKMPSETDTSSGLQQSTTFGLFHGHFSGFSPGWYATVGNQIMLTMTVLAFLPHLRPLVITLCWKPVQWLCIWRCCTASNQSSLNSMYDGIKFDIAVKYAAMLNMAAISMLYSAGLPLLYPIACGAFFLAFLLDRAMLFYGSYMPPRHGSALPKFAAATIPWFLVGHLAVACYMFGNKESLESPSTDTIDDNVFDVAAIVTRENVKPLWYLFLFVLSAVIFSILLGDSVFRSLKQLQLYCRRRRTKKRWPNGQRIEDDWQDHHYDVPAFTGVFERELSGSSSTELSKELQHKGWTIAQHTEPPRGGRPATATRPKRVFLTKVWTDDGNVLGVPHVRRQMKRTWEVIRDTTRGYESYKRVFMRMYLDADLLDPASTLKIPFDNIRMLPEDEDQYGVVVES